MERSYFDYDPGLVEKARALRKQATWTEKLMWSRLRGKRMMGFSFRRQRPIGHYIPDFYCKELRLAIEIDGKSHESLEASRKDAIRQTDLEMKGITFLRFTDKQVVHEIDRVLETIIGWIEANAGLLPPTCPSFVGTSSPRGGSLKTPPSC